ncbi:MAG: DNA/RNA nuclease SfsA [Burkholderiales bacterium]
MKFDAPLIPARLVRRYKRFLTDVELASGETFTALCPNTGSLTGCATPGSPIWLSHSSSPTRKYAHTWELVETAPQTIVGINTQIANRLVEEAIQDGVIVPLQGYDSVSREVRYGSENSRIDFLLGGSHEPPCFVEVKNVTAAVSNGVALFPDAVSDRASKHLRELMLEVKRGNRAVLVFCVQRADVSEVRPADEIDPVYGATLREAIAQGVEALAYQAEVSPLEIRLARGIPVVCH